MLLVFAGDLVGIAWVVACEIWWQQHHIPHSIVLPMKGAFVCCMYPGVQGCVKSIQQLD